MPLHGKIVVVKRSGGDGTEFPITAACLFGRKPDCDIRIQLPQVSKEHCRIDLNENKEVILTNLSSVNPTRVNGEVLQQSERLKHGDVITIIDRSFRFEYPPAPTPKKRSSIGGKSETFKVLQDQQVGDAASTESGDKKISEVSTDPHLKDGTNHDNIQRSMEKPVELEHKEDGGVQQNQTISPFSDLYQMIKKSLDVKTPRKSSASVFQTPTSRFCTPKPGTVEKNVRKSVVSTEGKGTPKKDGAAENTSSGTPKSVRKQRKSLEVPSTEVAKPEAENAVKSETASPQTRNRTTPQKFTVSEVVELVSAQTPKSPTRRRSKEATPVKPAVTKEQSETTPKTLRKASPRNSGKVDTVKVTSKKRKSGELAADLPSSQMKKKRVSFGGLLNPELFDKRLPPDSPLRKGEAPRRSLCVQKPKQSLLRRASAIGLLQEFEQNQPGSPKVKSPARTKTPSPKKSPKSRSSSPKAATPAKKSPKSAAATPKAATPAKTPKSRTPSPKAATPAKTPKSRTPSPKAATPAKTPKSRTPSPKAATPAKTPKSRSPSTKGRSPSSNNTETPVFQTPTVQGRFSVSRISTPSPVAEDAVTDQVSLNTATPKIPLRRKSMKSSARKTPSAVKSAVKAMHRRSGISRASMKAFVSYADMVKFGQMKTQVAAAVAAKKPATKKTVKKVVAKLQTPARKVKGHVSTGHANSPATIVLGRAQGRTVVPPTGGAPKLVANIALLKKNMKMDEDLTGISEMYKTPVNQKKRRSVVDSAMNTPVGALGTSTVEPSVLNTPEEPGEMMVSPLSVSAVKDRRYNSEAVSRLLQGHQESVLVSDVPAAETEADSSEQQCSDSQTASVATPKQKPEIPECLTEVKRIMRTPRQKAEPVEDLRGRLLKTPKQKPEQKECLTGVKRIMRTPREKAQPVEDLRGKILKTPKQKLEQQECLTGIKKIFETPQQEAEPREDLQEAILETPKAPEFDDDGSDGVEEIAETAAIMTNPATPNAKISPPECLTGVKQLMKTPREKSAPVEDMVGVKRLMKTPRDKAEPVEENFGIKRLMKSPRLRGNAPVEDFEGLQELMEEPVSESTGPQETEEVEAQSAPICGADVPKELDFVHEEPQDGEPSDVMGADMEKGSDEVVDDHSEAAVDENVPVEEPKEAEVSETATDLDHGTAMETVPQAPVTESSPEVETATCEVAEMDEPVVQKKSVRGRRAKTAETKPAEEKQEAAEPSEEPVVSAPVRGRRGKKTEAAAPPAVRQTKGTRNAKTTESGDVEVTEEKVAPKPKRGRNAKKVSEDQAETAQEVVAETELAPEPEREQVPPVDADHTAPVEKAVPKARRGRKAKLPEQQDDVPQPEESDAKEVCSDLLDVVPSGGEENKSSDAMETVPPAPATESSPEVETATCEVAEMDEPVAQKKSVRGRRAKMAETKPAEEKQEAADPSEEPVVPAPVRGRRGKKTEAAAPPAVRQTKRGRNAKSQESTSEDQPETVVEKAVELTSVTEISTEAEASDLPSSVNPHQEEEDSAAPAEEAVVKPVRGRKTKQTRAEPPKPEPAEEVMSEEAEPQKAAPAVEKPRRGRRAKPETVEQNEVAEDTVVAVETKQQSRAPARAKRGRNAKQEEEKPEKDAETTESQEPVEAVVPEEAEAPLVPEPVKVNEPAAKPRRGGRKTKQDTVSETAVESVEVQEVSAATSVDKPKRGRRGKQVTEEAEVAAAAPAPEDKPDHEVDAEEETKAEPEAPVVKSGRAKRAKNEDSQDIAAKRTRRGAAPALKTESTVLVSESATASAEPVRRGRRAAAKPAADDAKVTSDPANPAEDDVADTNPSARSVKWKEALEVIDITPARTARGKRANVGAKVVARSITVSKDADKTEEKDLSDAVAQPVKRARRGAKVAEVTAEEAEPASKVVEAETQPKTRRGRSAKK